MSIDSLAAALKRQLSDAFPATSIPGRDRLAADPMDPLVARYLEAELDRRVEDELARVTYEPSEWVSGEDRETVDRAKRNFRASISAAVSFPESMWESLLETSAFATCRFVVSPVSTLVSEVFRLQADSVSKATARTRVRALGGHPFITEAADSWLATAEEPILRKDFALALERIADELMDGEERWVAAAEPLFALHERINGRRAVPIARLQNLYADLRLESIVERLELLAAEWKTTAWTDTMLVRALSGESEPTYVDAAVDAGVASGESVATEPERATPDVPDRPAETAPPTDRQGDGQSGSTPSLFDPVGEQAGKRIDDSSRGGTRPAADPKDPVPLWMRFQERINAPMKVDPKPKAPPRPGADVETRAKPAPAADKSTRPLWERYRKPTARAKISADASVQEQEQELELELTDFDEVESFVLGDVDIERRQNFIYDLFNGQEDAYRKMVVRLADVGTWPEATAVIANDIFRRNRVNIYDETAIDFTNAVERRYLR